MDKDPMHLGSDADPKYTAQAQAIVDFRDKVHGGVLNSLDQLKGAPGVDPAAAGVGARTDSSSLISACEMLRLSALRLEVSCGRRQV